MGIYCTARNFLEFRDLVAICKSFRRKICRCGVFWWYKQANLWKLSPQNCIFLQFVKVLSLKSFPLYGMTTNLQLCILQEGCHQQICGLKISQWIHRLQKLTGTLKILTADALKVSFCLTIYVAVKCSKLEWLIEYVVEILCHCIKYEKRGSNILRMLLPRY